MSDRHLTSRIRGFLDNLGCALAVSAAVRNHRQPRSTDLRRLGIDPDQFRQIGR